MTNGISDTQDIRIKSRVEALVAYWLGRAKVAKARGPLKQEALRKMANHIAMNQGATVIRQAQFRCENPDLVNVSQRCRELQDKFLADSSSDIDEALDRAAHQMAAIEEEQAKAIELHK